MDGSWLKLRTAQKLGLKPTTWQASEVALKIERISNKYILPAFVEAPSFVRLVTAAEVYTAWRKGPLNTCM